MAPVCSNDQFGARRLRLAAQGRSGQKYRDSRRRRPSLPETCLDSQLTYPPDADLRRLLRFEPDSGTIWLGERRMVLLHTAALT
ncbi:MAG: XylR N-terminal domain-containing protein, partial [Hydrogenophaga sp.]|nr:XylR N-terminal domain-containing protein [Hydrogenophaga sp.]